MVVTSTTMASAGLSFGSLLFFIDINSLPFYENNSVSTMFAHDYSFLITHSGLKELNVTSQHKLLMRVTYGFMQIGSVFKPS